MSEQQSVYRIMGCQSEVEPGKVAANGLPAFIAEAAVEAGEGNAVCWLHHAVLIGKVAKGVLSFRNNELPDYTRHLLRIRIFGEEKECHIWKSGSRFSYRKRHDTPGDTVEYVQAVQPLWGTQAEPDSASLDWSRVFEDRGIELFVPFSGLSLDKDTRLSIVTRNYLADRDQAGYADCRFIKFDWAGG